MAEIPNLNLPSGDSINFGDPDLLVRGRDTKNVLAEIGDTWGPAGLAGAVTVLAPRVIRDWSRREKATIAAIEDLPHPDFMALLHHLTPVIEAVVGGHSYEPVPKGEEEAKGEDDAPGTE